MNALSFFCWAMILNFCMSLRVFFIDQFRDQPIRLCPYQGCSSWTLSSFCFSCSSRLCITEVYRRDDRAIENICENTLHHTRWRTLLWFSSYTSLTKSVFFIFFFHSLNHDAKRSYDANEIFFFSLKLMDLTQILGVCLSSTPNLRTKPSIDRFDMDSEFGTDLCNRAMIFFCLFEDRFLYNRVYTTKSWHTVQILGDKLIVWASLHMSTFSSDSVDSKHQQKSSNE